MVSSTKQSICTSSSLFDVFLYIYGVEKTLARRQLTVKSKESNSWFIEIKNILRTYNMLEAWWYLDNALTKAIWTTAVKKKMHEHWSKPIVESILYLCLVVGISNWFLYHLIFLLFLGVLAF
jgi:hypothetical protein